METNKTNSYPPFMFLGYHIQSIDYKRIDNEELVELRVIVNSKEYNKDKRIYSLTMSIEIDFESNKKNTITFLGGFEINDETILKDENLNPVSIFASSLFPFMRNSLYNITLDDRESVKLPTLDFRYIDTDFAIVLSKEKNSK